MACLKYKQHNISHPKYTTTGLINLDKMMMTHTSIKNNQKEKKVTFMS